MALRIGLPDVVNTKENQTIDGTKTFNSPIIETSTPTASNHVVRLQDFEYGDNANGKYMKFPNGVMICWQTNQINMNTNLSWGNLYYGIDRTVHNFPVSFVSPPIISKSVLAYTSAGVMNGEYENMSITNTGYSGITIVRPDKRDTVPVIVHIIAIGRWK